jgi:hypothetical protein
MMVKKGTKAKVGTQAKIGIVIYTPEGMLIPSAATLAKMKAGKKK